MSKRVSSDDVIKATNNNNNNNYMEVENFSSTPNNNNNNNGENNLAYVVHKVGLPPKQNLLKEIKSRLKETFMHDDPLRHFKDQPTSTKFVLGLKAIFPILDWGKDYNLIKFKGDLIAGLTIASLCIPQVPLIP